MSAAEFAEWGAYYSLEPFGEDRADLRMGILACATLSPHVRKGKKLKPSDFIPRFAPKQPQTPKEISKSLRKITVAMGGSINGNH